MSQESYSLDTNSLLLSWYQTYRPTSFPSFWTHLDNLMSNGRAFVSSEVLRELSRKNDDVHTWVAKRVRAVVELETEQLILVRDLATKYPALAKQRMGQRIADGFVVALAQWKGLTVVTAENHKGPAKIPNICSDTGVSCITLADLIAKENWTF